MAAGKGCQRKPRYGELKPKEKSRIEAWLLEETLSFYSKEYVLPDEARLEEVARPAFEKAQAAGIFIGFGQVQKHYKKIFPKIRKTVKRQLKAKENRGLERAIFTNMCMVMDAQGHIVALDKKSGGYVGTTLPGGHVEKGETFSEAVVREVREETGLEIQNPVFCGVYHWYRNSVHNVILLYRATSFCGKLKASAEGEVYWILLEEYRQKKLAGGMDQVLKIIADGLAGECYMYPEEGRYKERLF